MKTLRTHRVLLCGMLGLGRVDEGFRLLEQRFFFLSFCSSVVVVIIVVLSLCSSSSPFESHSCPPLSGPSSAGLTMTNILLAWSQRRKKTTKSLNNPPSESMKFVFSPLLPSLPPSPFFFFLPPLFPRFKKPSFPSLQASNMSLLGGTPLFAGVDDFLWSPTDNIMSCWYPG